MFVGTLYQTST